MTYPNVTVRLVRSMEVYGMDRESDDLFCYFHWKYVGDIYAKDKESCRGPLTLCRLCPQSGLAERCDTDRGDPEHSSRL